ncbi:hypothetical protein [Lactococcus sp.]|uniref:hypothetical protein n=1 Tax=Lactococcus sp. TaxID=44273 RepID=UPI0035B3BE93
MTTTLETLDAGTYTIQATTTSGANISVSLTIAPLDLTAAPVTAFGNISGTVLAPNKNYDNTPTFHSIGGTLTVDYTAPAGATIPTFDGISLISALSVDSISPNVGVNNLNNQTWAVASTGNVTLSPAVITAINSALRANATLTAGVQGANNSLAANTLPTTGTITANTTAVSPVIAGTPSATSISANISAPGTLPVGFAANAQVKYTLTPKAAGGVAIPATTTVPFGTAYEFTNLPTNTEYTLSAVVTASNFSGLVQPANQSVKTGFSAIALTAQAHVQGLGWMSAITDPGKGDFIGTTGRSLRMEAAHLTGGSDGAGGTYTLSGSAHLQDLGDVDGTVDANGLLTLGTTGQSRRMEGLSLKVNSTNPNLRVFYRVHVQGSGWTGWFSDGQFAGTKGKSLRMEALEVHVIDPTAGDALPFGISLDK